MIFARAPRSNEKTTSDPPSSLAEEAKRYGINIFISADEKETQDVLKESEVELPEICQGKCHVITLWLEVMNSLFARPCLCPNEMQSQVANVNTKAESQALAAGFMFTGAKYIPLWIAPECEIAARLQYQDKRGVAYQGICRLPVRFVRPLATTIRVFPATTPKISSSSEVRNDYASKHCFSQATINQLSSNSGPVVASGNPFILHANIENVSQVVFTFILTIS